MGTTGDIGAAAGVGVGTGGDVAILGLTLGSPSSEAEVAPFLHELFADRGMIRLPVRCILGPLIARLRTSSARRKYRRIGGASPLMAISRRQVEAVARALRARGVPAKAYVAARYLGPRVGDVLGAIAADGAARIVALPLYPQRCRATTGSALADLDAARGAHPEAPPVVVPPPWFDHPRYVAALASTVREAPASLGEEEGVHLLFVGHSVPQRLVEEGDPYAGEVDGTARAVVAELGWTGDWSVAWQSRVGPVRWLRPEARDEVKRIARAGTNAIVCVPVSFMSDHLETLYDLDIDLAETARAAGIIRWARCPALNVRPDFIAALADVVEGALGGEGRA